MNKKVAIVGGAASWIEAPFDDETWDIWVHGNQMDRYHGTHRVTQIFEIHEDLSEHDPGYMEWLRGLGIPLITPENYPFDAVNKLMAGPHLTSTPAYMMGLALLEGYEEISLFGVDMAVDDHEYFYQRPTMYAWIGYALAKGIIVNCYGGLFKDDYIEGKAAGKPDIGLPPFTESELLAVCDKHQRGMAKIDEDVHLLEITRATHNGAMQAYQRLAKVARAIEAGVEVKNLTDSLLIRGNNGNSRADSG